MGLILYYEDCKYGLQISKLKHIVNLIIPCRAISSHSRLFCKTFASGFLVLLIISSSTTAPSSCRLSRQLSGLLTSVNPFCPHHTEVQLACICCTFITLLQLPGWQENSATGLLCDSRDTCFIPFTEIRYNMNGAFCFAQVPGFLRNDICSIDFSLTCTFGPAAECHMFAIFLWVWF